MKRNRAKHFFFILKINFGFSFPRKCDSNFVGHCSLAKNNKKFRVFSFGIFEEVSLIFFIFIFSLFNPSAFFFENYYVCK